jgi:all-trans-retinol 13,14-reductase
MRPLAGYLDGLTGSRELKAVLAAGNPRYGLPPSQCPTYLHLLVLDSYLQSSWRVDEAHCPLAIAFEAALLEAGGQLRCGARIAAIECPGGRVRGVRLADGERIPAATVVFTGDPRQLPVLCGGELRPAYLSHLAGAGATPGAFVSAVAWEGSSCPAADRDIYVYDTWDMEEVYGRDRHLSQDGPPRMVYFAASDRGADGAFPMTALCLADGGEWAPWAGSRVGSRPDGYGQAKREMAGRLLSVLRSQWPNEARLRVVDSFSPLTIANYTLSVAGSCYGLPPERLTAAARVVGLHLAGQSVHGPGIIGATLGALEACGRILEERLGSQVAMGWAARTLGPCLAR